MKKIIFFVVIISFLFSGCFLIKQKQVEIKLFNYKIEYNEQLQIMADMFSKANPKYKIIIESTPFESLTMLKTALDNKQEADIVMMPPKQLLYTYAQKGVFADLSNEKLASDIFPGLKRSVSFNNKLYALPVGVKTFGIIYNKGIFDKYKIVPPKTFNELKNVCEVLKKNGLTPFAPCIKDNWVLAYVFSAALSQALGNSVESWQDAMNKGVSSFNFNKSDLIYNFLDFTKSNSGNNYLESTYQIQSDNFKSEKYAMILQGLWSVNKVKNLNPKLNLGVFPLILSDDKALLYTDVEFSFAVSSRKAANVIKGAKLFLDFMTNESSYKIWIDNCNVIPAFKPLNFTFTNLYQKDIVELMNSDSIVNWYHENWKDVIFEQSKTFMEDYYKNKKTKVQIMSALDNLWLNSLKN